MLITFATKLATRFNLSPEDQEAIISLSGELRRYSPGDIITAEEKPTKYVGVVISGFASSFKVVHRRGHQVTGFMLPGDAINIPSILIKKPPAHLIANIETYVQWISHQDLRRCCLARPSIASALWFDTLIDAGIAQEWMANIGRRRARYRIAHLFLEVATRQERIGALFGDTFELPVKQPLIASAVGLSLVHTNKSLRALDAEGWISRDGHRITLNDRAALAEKVGFNPSYLWVGSSTAEPAKVHPLPHPGPNLQPGSPLH